MPPHHQWCAYSLDYQNRNPDIGLARLSLDALWEKEEMVPPYAVRCPKGDDEPMVQLQLPSLQTFLAVYPSQGESHVQSFLSKTVPVLLTAGQSS